MDSLSLTHVEDNLVLVLVSVEKRIKFKGGKYNEIQKNSCSVMYSSNGVVFGGLRE